MMWTLYSLSNLLSGNIVELGYDLIQYSPSLCGLSFWVVHNDHILVSLVGTDSVHVPPMSDRNLHIPLNHLLLEKNQM